MRSRAIAIVLGVISATASLVVAAPAVVAQSASSVYADPVVGITFRGAAGLHVEAAHPGVGGRTTQAIFATYRGASDPAVKVELRDQLVITAYVASRRPNEDLRAWAARNALDARYTVAPLDRVGGIVLTGLFQAGARKYALIPKSPDLVVVVDAFPTTSSRIGLFEGVLASLEVR